MRKLLLVVDPQIDFISGTLAVPHAEQKMDSLARYIEANGPSYYAIFITVDFHPWDHCSFVQQGGQWPRHCVQHSVGAAIYEPVLQSCANASANVRIFVKGNDKDKEEYSIANNTDSFSMMDQLIHDMNITHIDICGIAGDVCVSATLSDLVMQYPQIEINVLHQYSPSLDDGTKLKQLTDKLLKP